MNDSSLEQLATMLAERVQSQNTALAPTAQTQTEQSSGTDSGVVQAREQVSTLVRTVERVSSLVSAPIAAATQARKDFETEAGPGVVGTLSKFVVSPILGAVFSLFGSGSEEPAPVLPKFYLPDPVRTSAGVTRANDSQIVSVDQNFLGQRRAIAAEQRPQERAIAAGQRPVAPQVTVQIQAMDSRSFLDRSDEIAQAVREAVLNSHALNDVLMEL